MFKRKFNSDGLLLCKIQAQIFENSVEKMKYDSETHRKLAHGQNENQDETRLCVRLDAGAEPCGYPDGYVQNLHHEQLHHAETLYRFIRYRIDRKHSESVVCVGRGVRVLRRRGTYCRRNRKVYS